MPATKTRQALKVWGSWKGELPLQNLYTAGIAGNEFFRVLKERGELLGAFCQQCEYGYVPARSFCERCFADLSGTFKTVSSEGVLLAWTQCHRDRTGKTLKKPVWLGAVRLQGSSSALIHILKVPPQELHAGRFVRAIFKPAAQRVGSILDLSHFE
ncbi:MAG: Zn-ribbon domain-containing OB-fold protein [Elusimicrobia bacterium]|nr:Zn-ribbon domain-containing OB-fold protein [Elusimicrobiota bacterium]